MPQRFATVAGLISMSLALACCWMGMTGCARPAREGFNSPTPDGRLRAIATALKTCDGSPATLRQLVVSLGSDDPLERLLAARALEQITGHTHEYQHFDELAARQAAINRWLAWLHDEGLAEGPIVLWNVTPQPDTPRSAEQDFTSS